MILEAKQVGPKEPFTRPWQVQTVHSLGEAVLGNDVRRETTIEQRQLGRCLSMLMLLKSIAELCDILFNECFKLEH